MIVMPQIKVLPIITAHIKNALRHMLFRVLSYLSANAIIFYTDLDHSLNIL